MEAQPTLAGVTPSFVRKVHRGLLTPRAFMSAVLDDEDLRQAFGVEDWAAEYAEPGYTEPAKPACILFGNWNTRTKYNPVTKRQEDIDIRPKRFSDIAEKLGYVCEWSDEWTTCNDCQKAVRTSPDSYSWSPAYALVNECEIVCLECIAADPSDYLDGLVGSSDACVTEALASRIDLAAHGFTKHNPESYESGWHPGQTDSPAAIAKHLESEGITDYLFVQDEQSQFYTKFSVYIRTEDNDHD